MIGHILKNRFLVGLIVAVVAGFLMPAPGAPGGFLRPELTTRWAVVVIFLVQGMVLPFESLRAGLMNWRLHLFVQGFVFVAFPLMTMGLVWAGGAALSEELQTGFLFLAVLPTTVSTAIVFTSMAGGNAAGALVNVTLANILGVILTPLWMGWFLEMRGESISIWPLIVKLTQLVLFPLVAGQLARPVLRAWIERHKRHAGGVNTLLVLFIVYAAFAGSVQSGVFVEHGWDAAWRSVLGSVLLFGVVQLVMILSLQVAGLANGDGVAAMFCGTQKTLAAGVPMAKLIFAANPALGLILLPVMIYHPVQLFVGGLLIHWLNARKHEKT